METVQTIRDNHAARWDLPEYQHGWYRADDIIVTDYVYLDYPTASAMVRDMLARHNGWGKGHPTHYEDLGFIARWIAAVNVGGT